MGTSWHMEEPAHDGASSTAADRRPRRQALVMVAAPIASMKLRAQQGHGRGALATCGGRRPGEPGWRTKNVSAGVHLSKLTDAPTPAHPLLRTPVRGPGDV